MFISSDMSNVNCRYNTYTQPHQKLNFAVPCAQSN